LIFSFTDYLPYNLPLGFNKSNYRTYIYKYNKVDFHKTKKSPIQRPKSSFTPFGCVTGKKLTIPHSPTAYQAIPEQLPPDAQQELVRQCEGVCDGSAFFLFKY